jgi:hypothetical protein
LHRAVCVAGRKLSHVHLHLRLSRHVSRRRWNGVPWVALIPKSFEQRFRSLELAGTTSVDTAATGRALTRAAMSDPDWGTDAIKLMHIEGPDGDAWLSYKWHVWWTLPAHWRDDLTLVDGETAVAIVRPDVAMSYVSMQRTLYTSERLDPADKRPRVSPPKGMHLHTLDDRLKEFPLIRPRLPDSDWQLETVGQESYLGRATRRVRATRRPDSNPWEFGVSGFWMGVDDYECIIDDELQILLSVTAIVDSVSAATISVERVIVDEPIPASTFDFSPPAGTRIAQVSEKNTH